MKFAIALVALASLPYLTLFMFAVKPKEVPAATYYVFCGSNGKTVYVTEGWWERITETCGVDFSIACQPGKVAAIDLFPANPGCDILIGTPCYDANGEPRTVTDPTIGDCDEYHPAADCELVEVWCDYVDCDC